MKYKNMETLKGMDNLERTIFDECANWFVLLGFRLNNTESNRRRVVHFVGDREMMDMELIGDMWPTWWKPGSNDGYWVSCTSTDPDRVPATFIEVSR